MKAVKDEIPPIVLPKLLEFDFSCDGGSSSVAFGRPAAGWLHRAPSTFQSDLYLAAGIITIRQIDEGAAAAVSADG